jgi:hypothetical protein
MLNVFIKFGAESLIFYSAVTMRKAPNSNIQAPEKLQVPNFKMPAAIFGG